MVWIEPYSYNTPKVIIHITKHYIHEDIRGKKLWVVFSTNSPKVSLLYRHIPENNHFLFILNLG